MESVQSVLRTERLDSLHRFEGCLPSGPHASFQQEVFKISGFRESLAPEVFTRVMAPVSVLAHRLGIRLIRYLDSWLILASSEEEAAWARDMILQLCEDFGIIVNVQKSNLAPSQVVVYLGVSLDSTILRASPVPLRIDRFLSLVDKFLSSGAARKIEEDPLRSSCVSNRHNSWGLALDEGSIASSQEGLELLGRECFSVLSRGSSVVVRLRSSPC